MKIRRDLIIVALAIFCLTATLFMIRPTKSNPDAFNPPNQWADIDDDGNVTILDAIILSNAFGQSVDPVKNVNVTNWPTTWKTVSILDNYTITMNPIDSLGVIDLGSIPTEGFSRVQLFAKIVPLTFTGHNVDSARTYFTFNSTFPGLGGKYEGSFFIGWRGDATGDYSYIGMFPPESGTVHTICGPQLTFYMSGYSNFTSILPPATVSYEIWLAAYMRNE